jgi:hypothetical protein
MKAILAAAAALGLAACGGSGDENAVNAAGNQANATAEANSSEPGKDPAAADANVQEASPPAADAKEGGPSATASSPAAEIRALLIGRWTDRGNCAGGTEFRENGTFTSAEAGTGQWAQSKRISDAFRRPGHRRARRPGNRPQRDGHDQPAGQDRPLDALLIVLPEAGDEAPSHPARIVAIAGKLVLQQPVLPGRPEDQQRGSKRRWHERRV